MLGIATKCMQRISCVLQKQMNNKNKILNTMKIVTWNVNSLKVRLPQVINWLVAHQPDILCLQETKLQDEFFPAAEIAALGYHSVYTGQKMFNGVALLSKQNGADVVTAIPQFG